ELHRRTEGWPAGLYLAALYLREGGPLASAVAAFGGGDRLVSEYMESEFLARISQQNRVFLTRTAVLKRMSGPLCEAVLELPGAHTILADLARSNLLLVPLDRQGQWYRYHHLFRDMVLAELLSAATGRPVEAERWADAVDRWQYGDAPGPGDPSAEAWAALLRAYLCRRGAKQMRADADEAMRRFATQSFVTPAPVLTQ